MYNISLRMRNFSPVIVILYILEFQNSSIYKFIYEFNQTTNWFQTCFKLVCKRQIKYKCSNDNYYQITVYQNCIVENFFSRAWQKLLFPFKLNRWKKNIIVIILWIVFINKWICLMFKILYQSALFENRNRWWWSISPLLAK